MRKWAITISPRSRGFDDIKQNRKDFYKLGPYLWRHSKHFTIYPELTFTMRLHYHGVIICTKQAMVRAIMPYLRRNYGYIVVKSLKTFLDHLRYLYYCMKEWPDNQYIFDNVLTPMTRNKWKPCKPKKLTIVDLLNRPQRRDCSI